ncbi:hypothetical protein IT413_00255 [Candidatus Peregrinibacteria bacterium]|nr:hypothetical protein [Candidatus Peregrinibacteria bacterium]
MSGIDNREPEVAIRQTEGEKWFSGTVESAISNALLVRLHDTQKDIWIVVNGLTELPTKPNPLKKINPAEVPTVRVMPRTLDEDGQKKTVEFAVSDRYLSVIAAAEKETIHRFYAALEKGQDPAMIEPAVPVVHAAKYANNRAELEISLTDTDLSDAGPSSGVREHMAKTA